MKKVRNPHQEDLLSRSSIHSLNRLLIMPGYGSGNYKINLVGPSERLAELPGFSRAGSQSGNHRGHDSSTFGTRTIRSTVRTVLLYGGKFVHPHMIRRITLLRCGALISMSAEHSKAELPKSPPSSRVRSATRSLTAKALRSPQWPTRNVPDRRLTSPRTLAQWPHIGTQVRDFRLHCTFGLIIYCQSPPPIPRVPLLSRQRALLRTPWAALRRRRSFHKSVSEKSAKYSPSPVRPLSP
ncbi:hypothetical protein MPTK1_1g20520 [Marchantia polymorpha subsp. ruderalis]|uniref:Uncharacterized protein n=2 Tax=Marchantia polymorpha TaxID=3197 RepID=A0AAF6ASB3_MARPO|nr:hypothetical protein MARPO_0001s0388 [Marchantia polymorpha]BBM99333.1 hypothetical protein Mp_1g20520 [Marchantia polymorpha subsp. ruderalis]|eukprot:PTQ50415.1 hypothetical protein MARPO_0001s0388 [Marchantia polymorpha]